MSVIERYLAARAGGGVGGGSSRPRAKQQRRGARARAHRRAPVAVAEEDLEDLDRDRRREEGEDGLHARLEVGELHERVLHVVVRRRLDLRERGVARDEDEQVSAIFLSNSSELLKVSTDSERENLLKLLDDAEDWLYGVENPQKDVRN